MRRLLTMTLMIIAALSSTTISQTSNKRVDRDKKAEEAIKTLERQWLIEPYFTSDMTAYDRMFCDEDKNTLLIPKRAFVSEKQLEQFLEIAYQKTVSERNGEKAANR